MINHAEYREQREGVCWEATDKSRAALRAYRKATEKNKL